MSAMEARTHSIASNTEHTRDHIHSRVADSNKQVGDFTPPLQRSPGFILATCQRAVAQDASLRVLGPGKHVERLIYIRIPKCILLKKRMTFMFSDLFAHVKGCWETLTHGGAFNVSF